MAEWTAKACLARQRGFSLVETLMVMGILSIVMMAVISLYIPAQRSTVVQNQVSDVQGNLRVAISRISQDLLVAGFLVSGDPIIFDSGTSDDPADFTIRTRLAGKGFGRILAADATVGGEPGDIKLTLSDADMAAAFDGRGVRIFNAITMNEVDEGTGSYNQGDASKRIYSVTGVSGDKVFIEQDSDNKLVAGDISEESVLVRVPSGAPPMQEIRYRWNSGNNSLERILNGTQTQILARNVTNVVFGYEYNATGRINNVDILIEGTTRELVANDAISGGKSRELKSSVTLRNVF